jgi:hypothetical protein
MSRFHSILVCFVLIICFVMAAFVCVKAQPPDEAQTNQFVLMKLKGRKGREPLPNRHLVIFVGETDQEARSHANRVEADTDARGVVTLSFNSKMRWFQVWHQVGRPCPGGAGEHAVFHSSVMFDEGAHVLDTCGPSLERLQPYFPYPPPVDRSPSKP